MKVDAPYRDAHTHLSAGACDLGDLDLRGVADARALEEAVARAAASRAAGAWIRAWGFLGELGPALGAALERAAPAHPVVVVRADGHAAWTSAEARRAAGDPGAEPFVDEERYDAWRRALPAPTAGERLAALRRRADEAIALGIGAVDDVVEAWGPEVWSRLADEGHPLAAGLWLPAATDPLEAEAAHRALPAGTAMRGVKLFLDGTIGARTAALSRPYADAPGTAGVLRVSPEAAEDAIRGWAARGWPVAVHALGDRAVSIALDLFERAKRPRWGAHRIEHAQVVARSDLPRFARAGVVASLQPGHWRDDRPILASRFGARSGVVVHPLASLMRAGAEVVLGSDWPVSSWDPAAILAAATDPERGEEALDHAVAERLLRAAGRAPSA